ncbi:MAG TPA: hypothetical protein VII51_11015 [Gaiellaceae bacterium]
MHTKLITLVAVLAALATAGAALADSPPAPAKTRGAHFAFMGQLTETPSNGAVPVTVGGGNKAALDAMLGQSVAQTFAYGATTEFLQWSKGIPTVVQPGALSAGDYVTVNVRAPRAAALATIEQTPSALVGDHGTTLYQPTQPLYLFRGTLTSFGSTSVAVHVAGGDGRAMRLLIGQSADQTFAFGSQTIFLLWQGKAPTVIDAAQLKVGDRIVVRIRAARGLTLAQVESTPAVHIGDREPPSQP